MKKPAISLFDRGAYEVEFYCGPGGVNKTTISLNCVISHTAYTHTAKYLFIRLEGLVWAVLPHAYPRLTFH